MTARILKARLWLILIAASGLLYVGMPCGARLHVSLVNGSKAFIAQLLDPANAAALVGDTTP
ncbi:MAG TPA: hypothetical protein VGM03_01050 [Phycisphaerae bacterium]|jgi:hypothetical protein